MSDLHLEFDYYEIPEKQSDKDTILILAGDIIPSYNLNKFEIFDWFDEISDRFKKVIYVAGNHEHYYNYYDSSIEMVYESMTNLGIVFLENEIYEIDNIKIAGTTLWSHIRPQNELMIRRKINDYQLILQNDQYPITPEFTNQLHQNAIDFLKSNQYDIVVTHHAPSFQSCCESKTNPISEAYATELEHIIFEKQPNIWVHGHVHQFNQYQIGDTLIISNCKGYPDENSTGFEPLLEIEIGE